MPPKAKDSSVAVLDPPAEELRIPTPYVGQIVLFHLNGVMNNPPAPAIVLKVESVGKVHLRQMIGNSQHSGVLWAGDTSVSERLRTIQSCWSYLPRYTPIAEDYAPYEKQQAARRK